MLNSSHGLIDIYRENTFFLHLVHVALVLIITVSKSEMGVLSHGVLYSAADCKRVHSEQEVKRMSVCYETPVNVVRQRCANGDIDGMIPGRCYWSLKLCKPADDERLVVPGWPVFEAFARRRPICMELACWCHSDVLDAAAAAAHAATAWEGGSRLGSTLFNRMMVGAGRGAVMIPALSGWWGGSSSAPLAVSALVTREVLVRRWCETAATPRSTWGNFSGLMSKHGVIFTFSSIYVRRWR